MEIVNKHMMATKAFTFKEWDISSDTPDLAFIERQEGDNYIGYWIFGLGFSEVRFPVETTRHLTQEEIEKYNNTPVGMGGFSGDLRYVYTIQLEV